MATKFSRIFQSSPFIPIPHILSFEEFPKFPVYSNPPSIRHSKVFLHETTKCAAIMAKLKINEHAKSEVFIVTSVE